MLRAGNKKVVFSEGLEKVEKKSRGKPPFLGNGISRHNWH